jgi:hypothetical protein
MPLLLYGCAAHPVSFDSEVPRGHIAVRPGRAGFVIAAPHGSSDPQTGDFAAELARRTGFGLVVATGFAIEPDAPGRPGRRFQVNRPFEGVPGRPPAEEIGSEGARQVYLAYERRVQEAAQGPLAYYAEIHGNSRLESANRIEIATVGIDAGLAQRLRTLYELIRDAHLRGHPKAARVDALVEPADRLVYGATGSKRDGILRLPARALHLELPRVTRTESRELYLAILADFLTQAATLPAGR